MTELGLFEAKNRLSELLVRAEKGEKIIITRRGKKIAVLLGIKAYESQEKIRTDDLVSNFNQFRKSASTGPESLKELIEEGR
jgi:prevent-host-death family protein